MIIHWYSILHINVHKVNWCSMVSPTGNNNNHAFLTHNDITLQPIFVCVTNTVKYTIFTTGKVLKSLLDSGNTSESDGEGNDEQTNSHKTSIPEVESNICVLYKAATMLKTLIKVGTDFDSPMC